MPVWGTFQRLCGAAVWYALIVVRWYHSQFIEPAVSWWLDTVFGVWEESVKAFLREAFATTTRLLNGVSAWAVSIFFKEGYYEQMRSKNRRLSAWQAWWSERARSSTFNYVLERDGLLARRSPSPMLDRRTRSSGGGGAGRPPLRRKETPPGAAAGAGEGGWKWSKLWRRWARKRRADSSSQAEPVSPSSSGGSGSSGSMAAGAGSQAGLPRSAGLKRSGSELFERPSGYGISEAVQRRGLLEDSRLGLELAVTAVFEAVRTAIRAALLLPSPKAPGGAAAWGWHSGGGGRPSATSRFEDLHVWTASDVILQAGYPLEEHIVTTGDGYILHMQRIPRKGAQDVAFFMHGILDTSLGWVANGVGSQAFAAWDAGHDVWLGNSRSNPPRAHIDPHMQGARYWCYTLNELGMEDVAAQVDHIHMVKTGELQSAAVWRSAALEDSLPSIVPKAGLRRTSSDSALLNLRRLELAAGRSDSTQGSSPGQRQRPSLGRHSTTPVRSWQRNSFTGGSCAEGGQQRELAVRLPADGFQDAAEPQGVSTARAAEGRQGRFRLFPFHPFKRKRKQQAALQQAQQQQAQQQQQQQAAPCASRQQVPSPDGVLPASSAAALCSSAESIPGLTPEQACAQREGSTAGTAGGQRTDGSASQSQWYDAREALSPSSSGSLSVQLGSYASSCHSQDLGELAAVHTEQQQQEQGQQQAQQQQQGDIGGSGSGSSSGRLTPGPPLRSLSSHYVGWEREGSGRALEGEQGGQEPSGATPGPAELLTPDREAARGVEHSPGPPPRSAAPPPTPSPPPPTPLSPPAQQQQQQQRRPQTPGQARRRAGTPSVTFARQLSTVPASEPYRLRAVGHSLGAGSLLVYAVMCEALGRPHRLKRMVLLAPAGFHVRFPKVFLLFVYIVPLVVRFMGWVRPGIGSPAYLPSSLLRYITFKLSMDLDHIPGLNELTRAGIQLLFSGDKSQWDRALQMPHYNTYSMPAISFHTGNHLMQLLKSGRFRLYDYGSPSANRARYGAPRPPDLAQSYGTLVGLPVDLVAGRQDGIIHHQDVMRHYEAMRAAGVQVSYKEFDVGHLDVTFAVRDDIRHYVMSRLQLRELLSL